MAGHQVLKAPQSERMVFVTLIQHRKKRGRIDEDVHLREIFSQIFVVIGADIGQPRVEFSGGVQKSLCARFATRFFQHLVDTGAD